MNGKQDFLSCYVTQSPSLKETAAVIVAVKRFLWFLITPLKWFVRDEPVHVIIYMANICLRIFILTLSVRLLNYPKLNEVLE